MTNPEIADSILKAMLGKLAETPVDMAEVLGIDQTLITEVMDELIAIHGDWFERTQGYDDEEFTIRLKEAYRAHISEILKGGGFLGIELGDSRRSAEAKKDKARERELQEVTITQAKKAMEDSDKALQLAEESLKVARQAKNASWSAAWLAIVSSVISSVLTWVLTKYFS